MDSAQLTDYDLYLFKEGRHFEAYRKFGSHLAEVDGVRGTLFTVWAPHARTVAVTGDFNGWQGDRHAMENVSQSGVWRLFVPGLPEGSLYKYAVTGRDNSVALKADPFAFTAELRPGTASRVARLDRHEWCDSAWMAARNVPVLDKPVNIYEVHLGSWKRGEENRFLTYRELADTLPAYAASMGFTHIELLPLAEHPLDASWGYQVTGFFAATSRFGPPEDLMFLIDRCHGEGIGVIMDWVPGHFCKDTHGLRRFDGQPVFESRDGRRAENPGWGTLNFDLGRPEVRGFLIANALFWLDVYHIDGLRTDAVASMLYLDYGKKKGQWSPNRHGGRENLDAIQFFRQLNEEVFARFPGALMAAEESTTWPMVSRPGYTGGLGFNFKWNMGWMNDMLRYVSTDPVHRKHVHHLITFSLTYAFSENFLLPLSHDEVVHGKKSLIGKMPGDYDQQFAGLRLLLAYMTAHPGKKLLFMGGEFGQFIEWDENRSLDWHLLDYDAHARTQSYVRDLNHHYRTDQALFEVDFDWPGFEWIDCGDYSQSVVSFLRFDRGGAFTLAVFNFTPVPRDGYRIGVPAAGRYAEVFSSDWSVYGGGTPAARQPVRAGEIPWHGRDLSIEVDLPPLAAVFYKLDAESAGEKGGE